MWDMLTWGIQANPNIADDVKELRDRTLSLFLAISVVGYLAWHTVSTALAPPEVGARYWALFIVVITGQAVTYFLLQRIPSIAAMFFLAWSVLAVSVAIWLFHSAVPIVVYPLVVFAAVALLNPLTGIVTSTASIALLVVLWHAGPFAFLGTQPLVEVSASSLLTIMVAFALQRNMIVAVEWALHSYEQAARNAQLAQAHRAELVRAYKQLDQAYYRLERTNAALELAWKAADAAERSKSEFVANISHELRTPLNLIVGFSEMIATSPETYGVPLPSAYRGDFNSIYRSAQHLLTLTDDVLDLARIGTGHLSLARELIDIRQIIDDACNIVHDYLSAKGLWLRAEVTTDLPLLSIDRLRIRQVLLNLLMNAARFTDQGGITVSVTCGSGRVIVTVADTGRGIASTDLPRVFDEFYQSEDDRPPGQGSLPGTGLGLPISKRFIELHGGQMGVASRIGVGTTFWFSLPTVVVHGGTQVESQHTLRFALPLGISEQVLIVAGGDEQIQRLLQRHLHGFRFIVADDLGQANSLALEFKATAILANLGSAETAEAECINSPVPVLHVPFPSCQRFASALGATAYLVKPITRADLRSALSRLDPSPRTILIVDDDSRFIRLITRQLHALGKQAEYQIVAAHSGHEALSAMEGARPDLVLLDLLMPDMGGEDVMAAITKMPGRDSTSVILMSAQEQIDGHIPLKGTFSITKPDDFRLDELLDTIQAVLRSFAPPRRYLKSSS